MTFGRMPCVSQVKARFAFLGFESASGKKVANGSLMVNLERRRRTDSQQEVADCFGPFLRSSLTFTKR